MARTLNISDGFSTVTLEGATAKILDYVPRAPSADPTTQLANSDGGEQPQVYWRNVTEPCVVQCSTNADAWNIKEALNRLFQSARAGQSSKRPKVYVNYGHSQSGGVQRSEILWGIAKAENGNERTLNITWTRKHFWDGPEQLMSSSNNVGSGTALTLYNHNRDANNRNNYVRISNVPGDLPTPARLELLNNYNNATRTSNFYLAHMLQASAGAFNHIVEMEDGTVAGGSSVLTDSSYSKGQGVTLNVIGTAELVAWYAALSTAVLQTAGGDWFRVLAYLKTGAAVADVKMRARLSTELITNWWEGPWVTVPTAGSLVDLGLVQLPPAQISASNPYPLTLELRTKRGTNTATTFAVDFLQLSPVRSWRVLRDQGYSTAYNVTLHDDPISGALYTDWGSQIANYVAEGNPIMLWPNETNMLCLLVTPTATILRSTQIKVYVRPRRLQV